MVALKGTNWKLYATVPLLVVLLVFVSPCILSTQAQNATPFTSADKFNIPNLNGSIKFAPNGSYISANLENDAWVFKGLKLNNSQSTLPLTLKISTANSNITIFSYRVSNASTGRGMSFSYNADAPGEQIINLGLNSTQANPIYWSAIVKRNVFLAQGEGWIFRPDNSFLVSGQTGNVSLVRFGFNNPYDDSDQPFLMRHSIIITTGAVLAAVTAVAVIIYLRGRT